MHIQSSTPSSEVQQKRRRLTEIVSRLGPDATPEEIRGQAYRDGFGQVSAAMLVFVRNKLWPDRPKRGGGRPKGAADSAIRISGEKIQSDCPACGSHRTKTRGSYTRVDGTVLRLRFCRECDHRFSTLNEKWASSQDARRRRAIAATEKRCTKCRKLLPISAFSKRARDPHLIRPTCRECTNLYRSVLQVRQTLRKFGLSEADYRKLLTAQVGCCAICGSADTGRNRLFSIDHCHKTGMVRGLLCSRCNLAIGNFRDDVDLMRRAIEYILLHREGI